MNNNNCQKTIALVGLSHKTAPLQYREKLFVDDIERTLKELSIVLLDEIVLLSTCNRFEIYFSFKEQNINDIKDELLSLLCNKFSIAKDILEKILYVKYEESAIQHLFQVTASIDSMVIGENEITSQVKKAYSASVENNFSGPIFNRLFHEAFRVSKLVKTKTEISSKQVSIASIAISLAKKRFKILKDRQAALLGAGQMSELILKYLTEENLKKITIVNRSKDKAERLIKKVNKTTNYSSYKNIVENISDTDLLISSITSDQIIIEKELLENVMKKREEKPLVIIDLGVPRNISPECNKIHNVYIYNLNDLEQIAAENQQTRKDKIEVAKNIIKDAALSYMSWKRERKLVPIISQLQGTLDKIRSAELDKFKKRSLNHFSDKDFELIEELTISIMNKTLHNPIAYLKRVHKKRKNSVENLVEKNIIEEILSSEK